MLQAVKSLFRKKAFVPIYNIHSYLQRSQIYNHFLKAFFFFVFCFFGGRRWFFQIRMSSSTEMRGAGRTVNRADPLGAGGCRGTGTTAWAPLTLCARCSPGRPGAAGTPAGSLIPLDPRLQTRAGKSCVNGDGVGAPRAASRAGDGGGVYRPWSPTGCRSPQQFRGASSEPLSCCKL